MKHAQQRKVTDGIDEVGARRIADRPLTIVEQIVDRVGIAIVKGEYSSGQHIPEVEIAAQFGVSHGPVREALRALEGRGLVEVLPRRGAFAIEISLDTIADIFNIRAALLGLAGHHLALRKDVAIASADLAARVGELRDLAASRSVDSLLFAHAAGRAGAAIYRNCGNALLIKNLRDQNRGSLWGLIWREHTLDFLTAERRRAAAADWAAAAKAIVAGNGPKAETIVRKALFESRDSAMATLRRSRGGDVNAAKFVRD
ncbi:GntR family transcriptional regulator [Bradyrhizobium japonicum]|uniref:GntR family transcriptional regulator n=1 Tax=Bradyrhizobium japonicum TaxID=375 RepID=UPI001BA82152|nr:GntR family transcriptional regulator [Bradyrhizobium japonicum]MBR0750270.1 GntR family transcriptional regulator [Bradyrhizobium japonicum]